MSTLYLTLRDPAVPDPRAYDERWRAEIAEHGAASDELKALYQTAVFRPCFTEQCAQCDEQHDKLWTVQRAIVRTMGHFAVFRLSGTEIVPDMSVPYTIDKLPQDALPVPAETAARIWHDTSGSHVFGRLHVSGTLRTEQIR